MKLASFVLLLILSSCATAPKPSKLSQMVCSDINQGEGFTYSEAYSDTFQKALPVSQMANLFAEVKRTFGQCNEVIDYVRTTQVDKFSFRHASGKILDLTLVEKDGVITGLWLLGERPKPITYKNWDQVKQDFEQYSDARLLLQKDGKNYLSLNTKKRTPLGSIFKIFILDELSQEIKAGKHTWNEELAINSNWKSLPSGKMQNEDEGTMFSLKHYASEMISISDNTATDHLFNLLGRGNIEKQIKARGLTKTFGWSRPFLSTGEFFKIRAFLSAPEYRQYAAGSRTERLLKIQRLQNRKNDEFMKSIETWQEPRGIYDAEWFSTPLEVCALMKKFNEENNQDVLEILSKNTPFVDKDIFEQVLYKGGSEPGVIQMAYHFTLNQKPVCLYAGVSDRANPVDERLFFEQVKGAIKLLQAEKVSLE